MNSGFLAVFVSSTENRKSNPVSVRSINRGKYGKIEIRGEEMEGSWRWCLQIRTVFFVDHFVECFHSRLFGGELRHRRAC